jgi:hypothetical protein
VPTQVSVPYEDVMMFVRLVIPAMAVLGVAWVLVQPDTPPVLSTSAEDPTEVSVPAPTSAVELLGETWANGVPGPVIRPLTAEEHAAAIAAIRQSENGATPAADVVARAEPLRRPVPRPVAGLDPAAPPTVPVESVATAPVAPPPDGQTFVVVTGNSDQPPPRVIRLRDATRPAATSAPGEIRWVVRRQGSGDVVAEVSLSEALAILTSR